MAVVKQNVRTMFCHFIFFLSVSDLIGGDFGSTMGCEGGGCIEVPPSESGAISTEASPSVSGLTTVCERGGCTEVSPSESEPICSEVSPSEFELICTEVSLSEFGSMIVREGVGCPAVSFSDSELMTVSEVAGCFQIKPF
ncbi:hypothetical protein SO802_021852 [Lithocarpus litseifolius]|uniref:Secreted protein n=1 Tax=Lithocarpus litseifolius TaxID=425828 RepID=A0AAW2CHB8_9ROSI